MSSTSNVYALSPKSGRATHTAAPLVIELIADVAGFERIEPEWSELLEASEMDGLFLTWEWAFTWWKHLASEHELHILAVRRNGALIAIAPFALRRASLRQVPPMAVIEFIGSGVVGSDYLDLIVRRENCDEVVELLAERLEAAGRTLALMRMRPNGPAAALVARMRRDGWRAWQGSAETCPFASLAGQSFDSYLAGLGSEHRYGFRRKLNAIKRRYDASFDLVTEEHERAQALETLFRLHAMRWQTRGEQGAFSTAALRSFHHELSQRILPKGWLRLWVLRLDGMPAAALYGFLYQRKFYFYQSGFDPAFTRDSVGLVLLGTAVRGVIEDGTDELDLLHGTERYKAHWTRTSRALVRYELYPPSARGWFEREATAITRDARRAARIALETGQRMIQKAKAEHA